MDKLAREQLRGRPILYTEEDTSMVKQDNVKELMRHIEEFLMDFREQKLPDPLTRLHKAVEDINNGVLRKSGFMLKFSVVNNVARVTFSHSITGEPIWFKNVTDFPRDVKKALLKEVKSAVDNIKRNLDLIDLDGPDNQLHL